MIEQNNQRQIALFVDVANCRNIDFEQLLDIARQHGKLVVAQAYGNFANSRRLGEAAEKLFILGVRLIHCPAWSNGSGAKSTADEIMMNDIRTFLQTNNDINLFFISSGDGHFVPTMLEIKRHGKEVIVMADPQSLSDLAKKAANKFIYLTPVANPVPKDIFHTLVNSVRLLQKAQSKSAIQAGNVKSKMRELVGEFDEKNYRDRHNLPFRKFTEFLEEAERKGYIRLIQEGKVLLVTTTTTSGLTKAA